MRRYNYEALTSLAYTLFLLCVCWTFSCALAADAAESVLTGTVSDAEGVPVEGAMVFVYGSAEVRRTADYISARTDREGRYRMVVPAGRYWLIARMKRTEGYGPLMSGDKHSGDPVEIDVASGSTTSADFVVTDLKEAMSLHRKEREDAVRISGRITDAGGAPVADVYVFAKRPDSVLTMPDYFSPWTDAQGRYVLYLPRGTYRMGVAGTFPPGFDQPLSTEMTFDADRTDMDMVADRQKGK